MKRIPLIAATAVFAVHLVGNPHYGFFRDELYFIICGFNPQFGYVDQPPVVPLLAALTQLFGHSLLLLRAVPAAFAAGGVYVTCLLAAEFGGGAFAQIFAALIFFFTSVLMSFGMKVGPDEVGLLTWPWIALLVVRITKGGNSKLWLGAGALAGISLESKYSVLFFLAAIVAALLIAPQRRVLMNRWFAAGCAVAALIALPNFVWQWHYGFPMLELLRAGQNGKNVIVGPLVYMVQEVLITGFFLAAVWIAGLIWLFLKTDFRYLGYAYVLLIAEMMLFHGKHYYPADVYPVLIAAGAVPVEAWTRGRSGLRIAVTAAAALIGIAFLPIAMPVLPETQFISYYDALTSALHVPKDATATEHGRENSALPGDWADMHGWPQLAAAVARIYDALPPAQRAQAVAVAGNYGEASAVAFFQPHVPVVSGHNQWWLWGTRGYSGNVLIDIGGDCGAREHLFRSSVKAATFTDPWAIAYESDLPIMLCRGIARPLSSIWPSIKTYE